MGEIEASALTLPSCASGDAEFAIKVLGAMGCAVDQTETTTTVQGPLDCPLLPIPSIDMETMTDAFLTASVLAAFASKPANGEKTSKIYGIENQRVKECDRIAAMVQQLSRFGVDARENPDGLEIDGVSSRSDLKLPHRGVKCFDDHRIAMSFSVLACGLHGSSEGAIIREKKCVEKTWPGWWDTLQNILGVDLEGVDITEEEEEKEVHHANSPSVADNKTIILVGMRGVGKTHAGKALAKSLSRSFIDMDTYLEEDLGKKIPGKKLYD